MLPRTFYYAALGISQIKKVCFQVLGRGIYSENTFLNEFLLYIVKHEGLVDSKLSSLICYQLNPHV